MSATQTVKLALLDLIERYQRLYQQETGKLPTAEADSEWLSPCLPQDLADGDCAPWQPIERTGDDQFEELEQAVGADLHPDAKAYWNAFYSGGIYISTEVGPIELLQPWNKDDYLRFLQNLTGHLLTQHRFKLEPSVFVGVALQSEQVICVADDGAVVVEVPGRKPSQKLCSSLVEFLQQAQPVILD